jgi:hypothetical protein
MKLPIIFITILCLIISAFGQERSGYGFRTQSYYGFSGLSFLPNAQVISSGQFGISYSSKPSPGADLNLLPYSVRFIYGLDVGKVEIATTNTPFYASERIYKGVSIAHGISDYQIFIPLFPAIKYQLMAMGQSNHFVAMAIGFALPYGGYYVVDKYIDVTLFDLTVHSGVSTKLTTYHVFAGLTFTFGERLGEIQRGFNLDMLIEASWGGSLKQLDKKEESFVALSFRHGWTNNLFITTFIRHDNFPLIQNEEVVSTAPTTRMGVGLDYHLN